MCDQINESFGLELFIFQRLEYTFTTKAVEIDHSRTVVCKLLLIRDVWFDIFIIKVPVCCCVN